MPTKDKRRKGPRPGNAAAARGAAGKLLPGAHLAPASVLFKPGQVNNPKGRPRGVSSLARRATNDGKDLIRFWKDIMDGKPVTMWILLPAPEIQAMLRYAAGLDSKPKKTKTKGEQRVQAPVPPLPNPFKPPEDYPAPPAGYDWWPRTTAPTISEMLTASDKLGDRAFGKPTATIITDPERKGVTRDELMRALDPEDLIVLERITVKLREKATLALGAGD